MKFVHVGTGVLDGPKETKEANVCSNRITLGCD